MCTCSYYWLINAYLLKLQQLHSRAFHYYWLALQQYLGCPEWQFPLVAWEQFCMEGKVHCISEYVTNAITYHNLLSVYIWDLHSVFILHKHRIHIHIQWVKAKPLQDSLHCSSKPITVKRIWRHSNQRYLNQNNIFRLCASSRGKTNDN